MKLSTLFLSLALTAPTMTFAGELISGNSIDILAIDGVKTKSSLFGSSDVELADGKHQLAVKYIETFGNEDLIESRPYIITVDVKGKTTIKTDKLSSKAVATNRVNKDLNWYVENDEGQYTIKNADQLKGTGFMPFSDIEGLVAEYNQKNAIALPKSTETITTTATASTIKSDASVNMIIEQYKLATTEQKKQFKIWLIENETK